jgi:hypothetical protein
MKTIRPNRDATHLAASVAPEDLNCGDYVAALNVVHQFPPFLWCCDGSGVAPDEPVQIQFRAPGAGTPLKIKAVCLPFVFVKFPNGNTQTMDVRQTQFVRLNPDYAATVWNDMKAKK